MSEGPNEKPKGKGQSRNKGAVCIRKSLGVVIAILLCKLLHHSVNLLGLTYQHGKSWQRLTTEPGTLPASPGNRKYERKCLRDPSRDWPQERHRNATGTPRKVRGQLPMQRNLSLEVQAVHECEQGIFVEGLVLAKGSPNWGRARDGQRTT